MCTACNVIAREAAAAIFILPAPQLMRTGRNDCQPALWSGVFLNAKPLQHYRSHNVVHNCNFYIPGVRYRRSMGQERRFKTDSSHTCIQFIQIAQEKNTIIHNFTRFRFGLSRFSERCNPRPYQRNRQPSLSIT